MSLAETQEIMTVLQEIMRLLDGVDFKADKLITKTPKLDEAGRTFQQAERLALRYLAITRRMGLPDEVDQALQVMAQILVMLQMIQMSLMMIKGGGIGALIGIANMVVVGMMANDMLGYDAMRGY